MTLAKRELMVPWEIVIPSTFFAASAICWVDPSHFPIVVFALMGFTSIFLPSVIQHLSKPVAESVSLAVVESLNNFTSEEAKDPNDPNKKHKKDSSAEKFFQAVANIISTSLQSEALGSTLKASILEMANNDELHRIGIHTIQKGMIKASEDDELRKTIMEIGKRAFISALSDKDLIDDLMESLTVAMVAASQNENLNRAILGVITQGMSNAFSDEQFVKVIRGAVKDTLSDRSLYHAGAKGLLSAANPFRSTTDSSITSSSSAINSDEILAQRQSLP